jgi:hypothetical protein
MGKPDTNDDSGGNDVGATTRHTANPNNVSDQVRVLISSVDSLKSENLELKKNLKGIGQVSTLKVAHDRNQQRHKNSKV